MNPALHLVLWSWAGSIPCSAPAALAREQRSQRPSAKSYNVKTCSILSKTAVGKLNFIRSPMAAGLGGEEREVYISIKPFLCSIGQGKKRHQQNRGCLEGCRKTKKKEHTNNMLFKIKETLTPQETKLSSLVSLLTNALNSWHVILVTQTKHLYQNSLCEENNTCAPPAPKSIWPFQKKIWLDYWKMDVLKHFWILWRRKYRKKSQRIHLVFVLRGSRLP